MNQLKFLTLFTSLFNICLCATFINNNALHEQHPDKCYDDFSKHIFSPGESYKPIGLCVVMHCSSPGHLTGYGCGKVIVPDNCVELPQDITKPYPFCCSSFSCPDENGRQVIFNPSVPRFRKPEPINDRIDNNL